MKRTRRNHTAAFKAKVALAAIKGEKTLAELGVQYDVHTNQITQWRSELIMRSTEIFAERALVDNRHVLDSVREGMGSFQRRRPHRQSCDLGMGSGGHLPVADRAVSHPHHRRLQGSKRN